MNDLTNGQIVIKQLNYEDVLKYGREISDYIYSSVKFSNCEESYSREQALEKAKELCEYVHNDKSFVIGAFHEYKMVGFLWAYLYSFREEVNRLYISVLHVLDDYRNIHVGTELLSFIEDVAWANGIKKVYLHTDTINVRACKFYEYNGFIKERIQYVTNINTIIPRQRRGGGLVLKGDSNTVSKYLSEFTELYYENVRAHEYENIYSKMDAAREIDKLKHYLSSEKAYLLYILSGTAIAAFFWAHPIIFRGHNRSYIHAFGTGSSFRGKGYASMLYEYFLQSPFAGNEIYTHVDAINHASCHIQEKYGFTQEIIQYVKKLNY